MGASVESSRVPAWVLPALVVVMALAVVAVSGVRTGWWRSATGPKAGTLSSLPVRQEPDDEPFADAGEAVESEAPVEGAAGKVEDIVETPLDEESGASAFARPLDTGPGGPFRAVALSSRSADGASAEVPILAGRGISAEVIPAEVGDTGLWYRVAVTGGYPELELAREIVDELKRLGYDGAWVHRE